MPRPSLLWGRSGAPGPPRGRRTSRLLGRGPGCTRVGEAAAGTVLPGHASWLRVAAHTCPATSHGAGVSTQGTAQLLLARLGAPGPSQGRMTARAVALGATRRNVDPAVFQAGSGHSGGARKGKETTDRSMETQRLSSPGLSREAEVKVGQSNTC